MSLDMGMSDSSSSSNSSQQSQSTTNENLNRNTQAVGSYTNGAVNAPQLLEALKNAQGVYQTVAPVATSTIGSGFNNLNAGANGALSTYQAGMPSLIDTLSGHYLDPSTNPGLQRVADATLAKAIPAATAGFEASGRYGSPLMARAAGEGAANAVGQLAYQNYGDERNRMLTAASQLPTYAAGMLQPGQVQLGAGYQPIQQYISALSSINPGTTGQYSNATNTQQQGTSNTQSSGTAQGSSDTSQFGMQAGGKLKG